MPTFEAIARRRRIAWFIQDVWDRVWSLFFFIVNPASILVALALFIVVGVSAGIHAEDQKSAARGAAAAQLEILPTDAAAMRRRAEGLWAVAEPDARARCVSEPRDADLVICLMAGR